MTPPPPAMPAPPAAAGPSPSSEPSPRTTSADRAASANDAAWRPRPIRSPRDSSSAESATAKSRSLSPRGGLRRERCRRSPASSEMVSPHGSTGASRGASAGPRVFHSRSRVTHSPSRALRHPAPCGRTIGTSQSAERCRIGFLCSFVIRARIRPIRSPSKATRCLIQPGTRARQYAMREELCGAVESKLVFQSFPRLIFEMSHLAPLLSV